MPLLSSLSWPTSPSVLPILLPRLRCRSVSPEAEITDACKVIAVEEDEDGVLSAASSALLFLTEGFVLPLLALPLDPS